MLAEPGSLSGMYAAGTFLLESESSANSAGKSMPVSILRTGSETTAPPFADSKRVTKLSWRLGPPTSSHGSQMLYECPKLVRL